LFINVNKLGNKRPNLLKEALKYVLEIKLLNL
jgi:hypothetical protein